MLKHDDVHDGGEHLLEQARVQLQDAQERGHGTGGHGVLLPAELLEEVGEDVIQRVAATCADCGL